MEKAGLQEVIEFLQGKFKESGHRDVTAWMRASSVSLSLQACSAVLLRGLRQGPKVMITLAEGLNCTTEEMQWVARSMGEPGLGRLMSKDHLRADESKLMGMYRLLTTDQKRLLREMASQMVPK